MEASPGLARRKERLSNGDVEYTVPAMRREEYLSKFRTYFYAVNEATGEQAENMLRTIFCPSCQKKVTHEGQEVLRVAECIITLRDDPLRNYPNMTHLCCHMCGWEEYVVVPMKQFNQFS